MRNINDVIDQIKAFIPEDEENFINDLDKIKSSVRCAAPEMVNFWWGQLSMCIGDYLPPSLEECNEWEREVGLTIMGKAK